MLESSFKILRTFGFLPIIHSGESYSVSNKWLYWTYFFHITYISASIWRVYYYISVKEDDNLKSFIYQKLLLYEPLFNTLYSLVIFYAIYGTQNVKRLLKCMNLLAKIKLKESSLEEKRIFIIICAMVALLVIGVAFVEVPCRQVETLKDFVDFIITLIMSMVQSFSLTLNCIWYRIMFDRLQIISGELCKICRHKEVPSIIKSYMKVVTFIHSFDKLNFFIMRNIWIHCVYDLLCGYKGVQMYWEGYVDGTRTTLDTIADIVTSFWNIYNVPIAFFLLHLSGRVKEEISSILNNFAQMNDSYKSPQVTNLLMKAQYELTDDVLLDHTSILHVFSTVAAYLITAEQLSDFVE